jgi:LmbE family N-acetylglucosaminyl deacetylase
MSRVLVLSPHPDDESIGCGGTILGHVARGDDVRVVFLTSGEAGGHGRSIAETLRVREREAKAAAKILGIQEPEFWHEPDGKLKATRSLAKRLQNAIKSFKPDTIYVTHDKEMHRDHLAAVRVLRSALRAMKGKRPRVLMYEVWTPIQKLDEIIDISPYMNKKIRAVRAYRSQCAEVGFVEAVRGLNRYRGELHSWPGGDYAEVFTYLET